MPDATTRNAVSTWLERLERLVPGHDTASPRRASARDTVAALDRLRSLVAAGMPAGDALRFAAAAGGSVAPHLQRACTLVERGAPLSRALVRSGIALAEPDLALLRAGESSGTLAGAIALLCDRLTERAAAKHRVLRALAYPAALLVVTLAVVLAMTTLVLPSFVGLYATTKASIPVTTRAMLAFGAAAKAHGLSAVLVVAAALGAVRAAHGTSRRARLVLDGVLLGAPLVGTLALSRARGDFYATVACLLRAGVDLETAIASAVSTIGNAALHRRAGALVRSLRRGVPLSAAVVRSGFDRAQRDAAMLKLGEATGDYPGTCERISRLELDDYGRSLDAISRVVEPAVLLVMAAAVSTAALAIYQPILGSAALLMGGS
jgi:type II secretory pathway component PulF